MVDRINLADGAFWNEIGKARFLTFPTGRCGYGYAIPVLTMLGHPYHSS